MPPPTATQLATLASNMTSRPVTLTNWSDFTKNRLFQVFQRENGAAFTNERLDSLAWAEFLRWMAFNGGSSNADLEMTLQVTVTREIPASGGFPVVPAGLLVGNTYLQIVSAMRTDQGKLFSPQRFCINFANEISAVLSVNSEMTSWGLENFVPFEYKQYAFPAGIYVSGIPPLAAAAISAARQHALMNSQQSRVSNHYAFNAARPVEHSPRFLSIGE